MERGGAMNQVRVERVPSLEAVRHEWGELAHSSRNVFATWEWASTWWRHYGARRALVAYTCRAQDGRLVALLPLYLWSARPVRIARFVGHGPGDQLGPVSAPADLSDAATALVFAREDAGLDLLLAELLPGAERWRSLPGARLLQRESSPTLSLARAWDAYLAGQSANFRQQVRRRERRLARGHDLRFRLANEAARLEDDMSLLFALHLARWGGGSSPFLRFEGFHRDFARLALRRGWLRLWFLELDHRPVAAWYGFRFGDVESYYQAGRDPKMADASVGFVLLAHSIREAANDGMREYRFLRGGEPYKHRFADSDPGLETVTFARSRAGKIAELAAAAGVRSGPVGSALRRLAAPLTR
jgi:CelD/BcsL family acetyltransferase involved in cellulose biosynthesis